MNLLEILNIQVTKKCIHTSLKSLTSYSTFIHVYTSILKIWDRDVRDDRDARDVFRGDSLSSSHNFTHSVSQSVTFFQKYLLSNPTRTLEEFGLETPIKPLEHTHLRHFNQTKS